MRTTARGTEAVHWYSRIWPTDNRDVTEVKTAVPFLIVLGQKARGFPGPPTRLRSVVMANKSVQQHYVTLMWAHSLLLPLFLFFLWFSIMLLHHGDCQRERAFCLLTMPGVSWTSPYMYSAKKAASGLTLYKHMATGILLQHHRFRPQKCCHNMFLQQMI